MYRKKLGLIFIILLVLLLTGCQSQSQTSPSGLAKLDQTVQDAGTLTLWILDVGQGDCLLLKSPGGQFLLLDGGPGENGGQTLAKLKQLGVREIDVLVVSHGHEDHVGGLTTILKQIPVHKAYLPPAAATTRNYEEMLLALKSGKALISQPDAGTSIKMDDNLQVKVIGPVRPDYEALNDSSLVLLVEWGKTSFLLTGDITSLAENDLLVKGAVMPVTVLKVAHHGSNGSTSDRWLQQLKPSLALISVGYGNDYGHPGTYTLQRLQAAGVKVLRTDESGTIRLVSDGSEVQVHYDRASMESPQTAVPVIGNRKSRVYHLSDSDHLPQINNQIDFASSQAAIKAGYHACQRCFSSGDR